MLTRLIRTAFLAAAILPLPYADTLAQDGAGADTQHRPGNTLAALDMATG